MSNNSKINLFIIIFFSCCILYPLLPFLLSDYSLDKELAVFESSAANIIFLVIVFCLFSFCLEEAVDLLWTNIRRLKWFKPRLGKILVNNGYITQEELDAALREQKLGIATMLLKTGNISQAQFSNTMQMQKRYPHMKSGEILLEMGYATPREIKWAFKQKKRKLGQILIEKELIKDDDLKNLLGPALYWHYK